MDEAVRNLVRLRAGNRCEYCRMRQVWEDHFLVVQAIILGKSPIGRVTVYVLDRNEPVRVEQRKLIARIGERD